ncbi:MAG TPA: ABC transporter substrate-binding protein [Caldisericia bacterium]|nr:ABC transporter substrate-binding protein [Caldisericia bacterium]
MNLNRWISILVCLSLFLVTTPWTITPGVSSIVSPAKASELLPEGTRLDTLQWTQEYVQKILALEIWESRDSRDAFQLVKRGDFARWLVKARLLPLKESKHTFSDLDPSDPNYAYIMTALEAGIIEKTDTFHPKDSILRADAGIWLVNAHGDLAKKRAQEYSEPLIPAQDGYDGIPERAIGALSTCYAPDYQLMEYRHVSLDDFRYVQAESPLLTGEAAYSLYQLVYPPQRGGEVVIGMPWGPRTLFSGLDYSTAMMEVCSMLYEGSSNGRDPYWTSFPALVKRIPTQENGLWKINHDSQGNFSNMEITFELRKGLKWSDGSPLTADDFVFGHYLYNHPAFPTSHSEVDFWIQKVEALDDYTVQYTWNTPYLFSQSIAPMPRNYFEKKYDYHLESYDLNDPNYYVPPKYDGDEGDKSDQFYADEEFILNCASDETYKSQPLHAGPYRVSSWEEDEDIVLEVNEHYVFGRPLVETVRISIIENIDVLLQEVMNNNVDMTVFGLTFDQGLVLHSEKEIDHIAYFTSNSIWEHIDLNVDNEVLSDLRVRQALLHGIDLEGISTIFFNKMQSVSHAWLHPKHPSYDDTLISKYPFDPDKARRLLDEAGWMIIPEKHIREKDGKPLQITFMTTAGNKSREQIQAVISSNWKDIGIDVIIKNEAPTSFFTSTLRERKFDGPTAAMYAWVMGPSSNLYTIVNSSQMPTQENGFSGQNYTAFKNETVDLLSSEILRTINMKEVYTKLREINSILSREIPSLPLFFRSSVTSVHKNLANFKPSGSNSAHTWNAAYWYWKSEEAKTLPPPKLQISPKEIDFGTLRKSDPPLQKLDISNEGGEELVLTLFSEYPALQLSENQVSIPPRESKNIQIKLDLSLIESYGDFKGTLNIESNDPEQAKVNIPFKGRYGVLIKLQVGQNKATLNGEDVSLGGPSFIYQGRTMVPLRIIVEAFGAKVEYIPVPREIQITLDLMRIRLWIDNPKALIESIPPSEEPIKEIILDVPPLIRNARSFVPIRFISETFGAKVEWEASTQTITIYYKP